MCYFIDMDIQKFINRVGITPTQLADALDLDYSSVNNWIRGKATPKYVYAKKMLEMGIRIDELFSDEIWQKIKEDCASEIRGEVELTPEECSRIVASGIESLKARGAELPAPLKRLLLDL